MNKHKLIHISICFLFALNGCTGCLVNEFAFHPEKVSSSMPELNKTGVSEFFIKSLDKTRIHAFYFECPGAETVVLYLHGNAGNAYHRFDDVHALNKTGTHVLLIDYRGYGKSERSPTEKGIYMDTIAAFQYLKSGKNFEEKHIFVLGRSIGTAAAIHVAQNRKIGGLILISPLSTGKDMAKEMGFGWLSLFAGSSFDNLTRAKNIKSPVLIIHGDKDRVIPIHSGKKVFDALPVTEKKFIKDFLGQKNDTRDNLYYTSDRLLKQWNWISTEGKEFCKYLCEKLGETFEGEESKNNYHYWDFFLNARIDSYTLKKYERNSDLAHKRYDKTFTFAISRGLRKAGKNDEEIKEFMEKFNKREKNDTEKKRKHDNIIEISSESEEEESALPIGSSAF